MYTAEPAPHFPCSLRSSEDGVAGYCSATGNIAVLRYASLIAVSVVLLLLVHATT